MHHQLTPLLAVLLLAIPAQAQMLPDNRVESATLWDVCRSHDRQASIHACTRIIDNNREAPRNLAVARITRARRYWSQPENFRNRAVADCHAAATLNPQNTEILLECGSMQLQQQQFDAAVSTFQKAVAADPNNAHGHHQLGIAYMRRGTFQAAIASLSRAIELDPNYAIPYMMRGLAYLRMNDRARALADFQQMRRTDPVFPYAPPLIAGTQYLLANDRARAHAAFQEIAGFLPEDPDIQWLLRETQ